MKFELTEEQEMTRKMVKAFAEKEIAQVAQQLDKDGKFPDEIIKKMTALALMGMTVPVEYGGAGMDTVSYVIAVEELSKAYAAIGTIMSVHHLACYPIQKFGTEAQKKKYLERLATGEQLGAFAVTEKTAGSDIGALKTTAVSDGNEYVLNGRKIFITNGDRADVVNVFAKTDESLGTKGISAFIVERGFKGFSSGIIYEKMGIKTSTTAELIFENCRVPKENLIGKEGDGFKIALAALDCGRIGIGAQAVGIAQAAFEESVKYSKQRKQFGKPICEFQAIQWFLADMATEIEAARMLVYKAAYAKDHQERYSKEAAMAKLYASEVAMRSAVKAVQIHGGYGYTKDYAVERLFRDAKITEIYEGTSEIQRLVIAASVLGR